MLVDDNIQINNKMLVELKKRIDFVLCSSDLQLRVNVLFGVAMTLGVIFYNVEKQLEEKTGNQLTQ